MSSTGVGTGRCGGGAQADELEFRFLRDTLQISDSLLSRQASTLEQAGYVAIRKGHVGKWPRTWLKLTPAGRTAFDAHLATLREIVESPPGASAADHTPETDT